jgi:hypothetical protein
VLGKIVDGETKLRVGDPSPAGGHSGLEVDDNRKDVRKFIDDCVNGERAENNARDRVKG